VPVPTNSPESGSAFDHALVIANPFAGRSLGRLDGREALRLVAPLGRHAELGWTERPGHATTLAADWANGGHDLVVVVGGDGTVHEVATGLAGTTCALAVLPSGSGNDFATGVGCANVAAGLQAVAGGRDVEIDVCALDDRVFVNSCGLLASGLVSGLAVRYWRWLGKARYSLAAARALFSYRGQDVVWTLQAEEGTSTWQGRFLLAEICNGPLTGGGFRFAPDASLVDGQLDAALIRPLGLWGGLKLLPGAARGDRLDHPAIRVHRGREIAFESTEPVAYHLDGEPAVLPAGRHVVQILDRKLRVRMR
jgi:YegS/Rv2252/BmrU family lipid kinase